MATKIKNHKFTRTPRTVRAYDWDKWLDGGQWKLTQGEDFNCSPTSFRTVAYRAASTRGLRVQTETKGNTVILQAFPEDEV